MTTVGVYEAKSRLSELIRLVEQGEKVEITRDGKPVAILSSAGADTRPIFGTHPDIWIADDFDEFGPELQKMFFDEDDSSQ